MDSFDFGLFDWKISAFDSFLGHEVTFLSDLVELVLTSLLVSLVEVLVLLSLVFLQVLPLLSVVLRDFDVVEQFAILSVVLGSFPALSTEEEEWTPDLLWQHCTFLVVRETLWHVDNTFLSGTDWRTL